MSNKCNTAEIMQELMTAICDDLNLDIRLIIRFAMKEDDDRHRNILSIMARHEGKLELLMSMGFIDKEFVAHKEKELKDAWASRNYSNIRNYDFKEIQGE